MGQGSTRERLGIRHPSPWDDATRRRNAAVVAQLTDLVARLENDDTETSVGLHELIDRGVRYVAGCQYAGITVAHRNNTVSNLVATHRYPMTLDAIQNRCGEGPCVAAAWRHHLLHIDDLYVDERWPRFRQYALEETPIRSVLSYELSVGCDGMAALTFYADSPHAFTDDSFELAGALATHVALAWSMMRRHDQFRSALASRDIIGQAKGVIMERFDLDAVEAFELLTRLSQESNTRLIEIATALINSEHPLKPRHTD